MNGDNRGHHHHLDDMALPRCHHPARSAAGAGGHGHVAAIAIAVAMGGVRWGQLASIVGGRQWWWAVMAVGKMMEWQGVS